MVMLIILAYGIYSVIAGNMSLGTLLAFESFIGFFLSPVKIYLAFYHLCKKQYLRSLE